MPDDDDNASSSSSSRPLAVGDTVSVQWRTWVGTNKPGGIGKVTNVHSVDGCPAFVDVKYNLGGSEKRIDVEFVSRYEFMERSSRRRRGTAAATSAAANASSESAKKKRKPRSATPAAPSSGAKATKKEAKAGTAEDADDSAASSSSTAKKKAAKAQRPRTVTPAPRRPTVEQSSKASSATTTTAGVGDAKKKTKTTPAAEGATKTTAARRVTPVASEKKKKRGGREKKKTTKESEPKGGRATKTKSPGREGGAATDDDDGGDKVGKKRKAPRVTLDPSDVVVIASPSTATRTAVESPSSPKRVASTATARSGSRKKLEFPIRTEDDHLKCAGAGVVATKEPVAYTDVETPSSSGAAAATKRRREQRRAPLRDVYERVSNRAADFVVDVVGASSRTKKEQGEGAGAGKRLTQSTEEESLRDDDDESNAVARDTAVDSPGGSSSDNDVEVQVDPSRNRLFTSLLNDMMMKRMIDSMQVDDVLAKMNERLETMPSSEDLGGPSLFRPTTTDDAPNNEKQEKKPPKPFTALEARSHLNLLEKESKVMVTWDTGTIYSLV